jgi:RecA/RadA recombinase
MTKKTGKKTPKCGKCGGTGHNARSCKEGSKATEASPPKKATKKKATKPEKDNESLDQAFDAFMSAAETRWPGSIKKASELSTDGTPIMSTGNFVLDKMTYGGLRRGRVYRFWGQPKSAKTGSALNCAEAFTNNHCGRCFDHRLVCKCPGAFVYAKCLFVDVEGRVADNRPWAEAHGILPERLAMVAPKGGEQVVDIADAALRSDAGIGLVIIDSIAQMTSADEVTKPAEKGKTIGRNAMLVNSALRKWVCSIVSKDIDNTRKPTIICINQIRQKPSAFGNPDTMPGGMGMGYASACDIKFTKRQKHYLIPDGKGGFNDKVVKFGGKWKPGEDDTADFIEIEAKVTDSGICPPGRYGTFHYWMRPGHGRRAGDTDNILWLWDYAKKWEVLKKKEKGQGYTLVGLEARTQKEMEGLLREDLDAQDRAWAAILEVVNK